MRLSRMTKNDRYNEDVAQSCERLGITMEEYKFFRSRGNSLHGVYVRQCNGYPDVNGNWDAKEEAKDDKRESSYTKIIVDKATELHLYVYFQTDPRGATVYLSKNPIPGNNYTIASCIY